MDFHLRVAWRSMIMNERRCMCMVWLCVTYSRMVKYECNQWNRTDGLLSYPFDLFGIFRCYIPPSLQLPALPMFVFASPLGPFVLY